MSDLARDIFDLVTQRLRATGSGEVGLVDGTVTELARALAAVHGEARLDGLVGLSLAIEFVHSRGNGAPAVAALTGVLLTVVEKTSMSDAEREALATRLKSITGADTTTRVLGGSRPAGTIPAGPGARFAMPPKKP